MTESLEADLARLTSELAGVRDVLAQRDRALVAAHRAIEIAQADNAAWIAFVKEAAWQLEHGARCEEIQSDIYEAYDRAIKGNAPGAALLAELDAARAVVEAARTCRSALPSAPDFHDRLVALSSTVRAYKDVMKAREG